VTFSDGTALGGNFSVVINSNGDWIFSGHMHDSGFDSYDFTLAVVVMTPSGIGYTLSHSGHTQGTSANPFGPNRDDDWTSAGNNPSIRENWGQVQSAVLQWRIVSQDLLGQAFPVRDHAFDRLVCTSKGRRCMRSCGFSWYHVNGRPNSRRSAQGAFQLALYLENVGFQITAIRHAQNLSPLTPAP
jgi:hypothetical protein